MRTHIVLIGAFILFALNAFAQDPKSTYCNFDDDNQVSIQYNPVVTDQPKIGKVWSPGVTIFVQTPLTLGSSTLVTGAYSVHFIPDKKNWTIIVNKNVTAGAAYDSAQDLVRTEMEVGELPALQKNLELAFAHMSPRDCSLRVYYQKVGAFAEFRQK